VYFVIDRDRVILSIDRFSLLRSSFTHFGLPVDNLLVQIANFLTLVQKWTGTGPLLYRSRVNRCSQMKRSRVIRPGLVQNRLETVV